MKKTTFALLVVLGVAAHPVAGCSAPTESVNEESNDVGNVEIGAMRTLVENVGAHAILALDKKFIYYATEAHDPGVVGTFWRAPLQGAPGGVATKMLVAPGAGGSFGGIASSGSGLVFTSTSQEILEIDAHSDKPSPKVVAKNGMSLGVPPTFGGFVYFTAEKDGTTSIARIAEGGGNIETVLQLPAGEAFFDVTEIIDVTKDGIFFTRSGTTFFSPTDSKRTIRGPNIDMAKLATSGSRLFVSHGNGIEAVDFPASGDVKKSLLVPDVEKSPLATDGKFLYFATSEGIERVGVDGSSKRAVVAKDVEIKDIAVDGERVYWFSARASGALRSAPKSAR